jgi:hypothetical protein
VVVRLHRGDNLIICSRFALSPLPPPFVFVLPSSSPLPLEPSLAPSEPEKCDGKCSCAMQTVSLAVNLVSHDPSD